MAIYEWHWPIVGVITWGQIPFTQTNLPINRSLFIYIAQHCHPMLTLVLTHALAYAICVCLGSTVFWRLVRHISDPDCGGFFISSMDDTLNTKPEKDKHRDTQKLPRKEVCFDPEKGHV